MCAEEVRPDDIVGPGVEPRHHRGLGGALDERVEVAGLLEVGGLTDVAVHELDARLAQARDVELRSAAMEVVERDERPSRDGVRRA